MGKFEAFEVWEKLPNEERELAMASLPAFREYCKAHPDYRPVHAERYLKKKRFEGHAAVTATPTESLGCFADVTSDQWKAWDAHYRANGRVGAKQDDFRPDGKDKPLRRGWYFEQEWPPPLPAELKQAA